MAGFDPRAKNPVHHSGTFAGNAPTMAAGLAALEAYGPSEIDRINALGDQLRQRLRNVIASHRVPAQVTGLGSLVGLHLTPVPVHDYRSAARGDKDRMLSLHLALLNHGVFARAAGGFFLSTPMTDEDIDHVSAQFANALNEVKTR